MAAKLKVTQVKSTISHIARNRATVRALGLHGIGSTSIITDNPATRGMVRQVRFLVTVEEIADGRRPTPERRHETPRPPARRGLAQAAHPRRPRHRRRQGQDRGPRHQGPEGASRRLASRPGSRAARRRSTCASRSCAASRTASRSSTRSSTSAPSARSPSAARSRLEATGGKAAKAAPVTVNQDILRAVGLVRTLNKPLKILGAGDLSVPLFVVADAFTASARAKIEAAGGSVNVLEVPEHAARRAGRRRPRHGARRRPAPAGQGAARRAAKPDEPAATPSGRGREAKAAKTALEGLAKAAKAPSPRPSPPTSRGRTPSRRPPRRPRPTAADEPEATAERRCRRADRGRADGRTSRPATTPDPCSNRSSTPSARPTSGGGSCTSSAC